jgi:hypothetical protein
MNEAEDSSHIAVPLCLGVNTLAKEQDKAKIR